MGVTGDTVSTSHHDDCSHLRVPACQGAVPGFIDCMGIMGTACPMMAGASGS
jgi:hypothetical protein